MRIYSNPVEAVREVERDLFEMGIQVAVQTMQDKHVADDPDYMTKELQAYGFQVNGGYDYSAVQEAVFVNYCLSGKMKPCPELSSVTGYIDAEFKDRISPIPSNPGNSYHFRPKVWQQFLHNGKFAYTYSERLAPQWNKFYAELREHPETRQAILNLHSNICPDSSDDDERSSGVNTCYPSQDHENMGGSGRIPCSLYYQAIKRNGKLDWIYAMRSCDFIVHFGVDLALALRLQRHVASQLGVGTGMFTMFMGSLHAYHKDLKTRGIF